MSGAVEKCLGFCELRPVISSFCCILGAMKSERFILWFFFLIASPILLTAQYQYELMKMSEGVHNGIWFEVSASDDKEVEEVWENFMDERSLRVKRSRRPREYRAEDIKGEEVSTLFGVDLFMQTEELDTSIRVKIWVRRGETYPDFWDEEDAQKEIKALLERFRHELKEFQAVKALEEVQDELKDMERDLKRLENRKERFEKKIEKAYEEIEENETNIEENDAEQKTLIEEIENQKVRVEQHQKVREKLKKYTPSGL